MTELFEHVLKLNETQVLAHRILSPKDIEKITKNVLTSLLEHKFKIIKNQKNINFIKKFKSKEALIDEIAQKLNERNFVATLEDWNDQKNELYLFSIFTSKGWCYFKVSIRDGFLIIISCHAENEKIYVDYRNAIGHENSTLEFSFLKVLSNDWLKRYNRRYEPKIADFEIDDGSSIFIFKDRIDRNVIMNFIDSRPVDKGFLNNIKVKKIEENKLLMIVPEDLRQNS